MIIFSEITCTANTTERTANDLVCGMPVCYADLVDGAAFKRLLKKCDRTSSITVEVNTFGYGEGDEWDATPEEVAYMKQRCVRDSHFLSTMCEKIRQYKIGIDLSAYGAAQYSFLRYV
jgi:hypothetical protein